MSNAAALAAENDERVAKAPTLLRIDSQIDVDDLESRRSSGLPAAVLLMPIDVVSVRSKIAEFI